MMNLIDGTDGIAAMEPFEGIYTAYGSDVYRYEFHADGSFYLILEENYNLDGNEVTLNAFEREFSYEYAENGGNLELSGDGTTIATLIQWICKWKNGQTNYLEKKQKDKKCV